MKTKPIIRSLLICLGAGTLLGIALFLTDSARLSRRGEPEGDGVGTPAPAYAPRTPSERFDWSATAGNLDWL